MMETYQKRASDVFFYLDISMYKYYNSIYKDL